MRCIKNNRRVIRATNAVDPATTTSANFGFKPVPNKGGKTTNFEIPEGMFKRELEEMEEGILHA